MKENQENRKLSKDEEQRLARFEARAEELSQAGFTQTELVVSSGKANLVGPLYGLALSVPFILLFLLLLLWGERVVNGTDMDPWWKSYPCIAAAALHSIWLLLFGILMNLSADGDLLIAQLLLRHKAAGEALYIDHPTKIGLTCFEK